MTDYRGIEDPSSPGRHARSAGSGEASSLSASASPAPVPETAAATASGSSPWFDSTAGYGQAAGAISAGGSVTTQNGSGARKLSVPKIWLAGFAGLLLILAGASVYSLVKVSSVQASLSNAQQQAAAAETQVSALQSEVTADQGELSTAQSNLQSLQGTVDGLSSLSAYTSKVCNTSDVYDDNTQQYITAYYPCTDDNPAG